MDTPGLQPAPPPVQPETPAIKPPSKKLAKHAKKFALGALILTLLAGGAYLGVNEVQRRQTAEPQAAMEAECREIDDEFGICLDVSAEADDEGDPTLSDELDDTNEPFDTAEDTEDSETVESEAEATGRIFLKIIYNDTYCVSNRPCEDLQKKTVVGWSGTNLADGPRKVYGNKRLIPLTNKNGKWIKDKPVFRSSPLVTGLGVTRLGNGRIMISHANTTPNRSQYNRAWQGIDAKMKIIGPGVVSKFTNGYAAVTPDKPIKKNGAVSGGGVDGQSGQSWSQPPFVSPFCGQGSATVDDQIVWSANTKNWQHYTRICWPGDDYRIVINRTAAPSPSPEPKLVCLDLTKNTAAPKLGDTVTFTCKSNFSSVSSVRAYFRYSTDGGVTFSAALPAGGKPIDPTTMRSAYNITIDKTGDWEVQCRVCGQVNDGALSLCTTWGRANVPTSGGID